MIEKPKYNRGDIVAFEARSEMKQGRIYIVDAGGTYEQNEEPSYDVMVDEENCLYKHFRESWLSKVEVSEENFENNFLQVAEKYARYYYSYEPTVFKHEIKKYELKEGIKIPTMISAIEVKKVDTENHKIYLEYCNKNYELETVELGLGHAVEINLLEGEGDVYRISECALKLVH